MAASSELEESVNGDGSKDSGKEAGKDMNVNFEDMKVSELKLELEKRNLDKTGIKSVLLERLKTAVSEEAGECENISGDIDRGKSVPQDNKIVESNGEIQKNVSQELTNDDETGDKDSIEVNINDEVIEGICDEAIDPSNESEDKYNSSEVTLQISIDEEDAKLNDEDDDQLDDEQLNNEDVQLNVEKDAEANDEKSVSNTSKSQENEVQNKEDSVSESQSTLSIGTKYSTNEDMKEKKKVSSKSNLNPNVSSPKVLKMITKNDKGKNTNALAKSLWITGLPNTTRAADLKITFSKQGRVLYVKIVKSTKQTPGKCYGFVTMATSRDASKAIQNLHRTEFSGRTISVERTQNDATALLKRSEAKLMTVAAKKQIVKKEVSALKVDDTSKSTATSQRKVSDRKVNKHDSKISDKKLAEPEKQKDKTEISDKSKNREREHRSRDRRDREYRRPPPRRPPLGRSRPYAFNDRFRGPRRSFAPRPYMGRSTYNSTRPNSTTYSFIKIREERLRLRAEREAERRKLEEITRHRYIERKQREEALRLEREKEKLRLEREMLERERAEIIRLEREKQRLERERLEREREELHQSELRRSVKRPRVERETEQFWDTRKKSAPRYDSRYPVATSSRYQFPVKERLPERYVPPKPVATMSRGEYEEPRREINMRSRAEERQVYARNVYRADRDVRSSYQDRERHSGSKQETSRMDWKANRRVHERGMAPSANNSASRRMYY